MTFLELAQRLRQETGVGGTGPTAVTGQEGILKRICDWIIEAWLDIQTSREDWAWMWNEGATLDTTADDADYDPADFSGITAATFGRFDPDTMKIYLKSEGQSAQRYLPFKPFEEYKRYYANGDPDSSVPSFYTILPDKSIRLYQPPNAIYTLTVDWYNAPIVLAADGDIPALDTTLHSCIWATALLDYAYYDEALTLGENAIRTAQRWVNRLEGRERPQMSMENRPIA